MNPGKRQLRLVEEPTTSKSEFIQGVERLVGKGLKVAIILAEVGDVDPLAGLLAASRFAHRHGENLVNALEDAEIRAKNRQLR